MCRMKPMIVIMLMLTWIHETLLWVVMAMVNLDDKGNGKFRYKGRGLVQVPHSICPLLPTLKWNFWWTQLQPFNKRVSEKTRSPFIPVPSYCIHWWPEKSWNSRGFPPFFPHGGSYSFGQQINKSPHHWNWTPRLWAPGQCLGVQFAMYWWDIMRMNR